MNPIGIVIAFFFLGSMLGIFRWMLAAFPRPGSPVHGAQSTHSSGHQIVVPVLESVVSMQATELACQLAYEHQAKIILASVIEVPMTLGLDVPLPGAMEKAQRLLGQSESIVMQHRLPVETCVLRGRKAGDAILELARETGAETIVVGARTASWWPTSQIGSTVSSLIHHAPCQVVVAKAAVLPA